MTAGNNTGQIATPLVSVLITSYNREKYIAPAIESVLASTYENFELIIVDDGSSDTTVSIAKDFRSSDSRIKVYENDANIGDYPNRNRAASYARGKYLKYVDSDDYIYPNGLEIMVNNMEQFPQAGFGLCSLKPDSERNFPIMLAPKQAYEYHFFGPGLFHKGPLTSILLKSAFDEVGGFKAGRMISDTDMWHRMGLRYPVVLMPDGIVWQRIHDKQELTDSKQFIVEGAKVKWKYLLDPSCPLTKEQIALIRKNRIKKYRGFALAGLRHFNFSEAGTYLKCLQYTKKIKI